MDQHKVTCPACKAVLVSKEAVPPGKRVRCRCGHQFVVGQKAPQASVGQASPGRAPGLSRHVLVGIAAGAVVLIAASVGMTILILKSGSPSEENTSTAAALSAAPKKEPVAPPSIPKPPVSEPPKPINDPPIPRPPQPMGNDTPIDRAQLLALIKGTTVFVKVSGPEGGGSGSGFVFQVADGIGYIATNEHVVTGKGNIQDPKVTVVFESGTERERVVPADVLAADPERDLAILRVKAVELPRPLAVTPQQAVVETTPVLICGFPFGEKLATGGRNPSITIGRGSVSSIRRDDVGKVAVVQIDGALNPGNSGGPIVDESGRLVGVAVATIGESGIGFAIPHSHLQEMLAGRTLRPAIIPVRDDSGVVDIVAMVPMIDPLRRLRSVVLHQAPLDALAAGAKPDAQGNWPLLPRSTHVDLAIDQRGVAVGKLQLTGIRGVGLFQVAYTDVEGKTFLTKPVVYSLGVAKTAAPPTTPEEVKKRQTEKKSVLATIDRFPERYTGQKVTVTTQVFGVLISEGETHQLQVFDENNARPENLKFTLAAELAAQVRKLGLAAENYPARLELRIGPAVNGAALVDVVKLEFLDAGGKVLAVVPSDVNAPKPPDAGLVTLSILNRAPEKYVGKQLVLQAILVGRAGQRGPAYTLNLRNENNVRPDYLDFVTSKELAVQLMELNLPGPNAQFVRITCTVQKEKDRDKQVVHVSNLDILDVAGKLTHSLPAKLPDGPETLVSVCREPEKHLGKTYTFTAQLRPSFVMAGELRILYVYYDDGIQPRNASFLTSKEIATQLFELGLDREQRVPVKVTFTVTKEMNDGKHVLQVSRIDMLDAEAKVKRSLPFADPPGAITLNVVNRTPEKYVGQTHVFTVILGRGAGRRGDIYDLQVFYENKVKPQNLFFETSRDLVTQISDLGLKTESERARITCTVRKDKMFGGQVLHVSRVDYIDDAGKVTRTLIEENR